MLLFYMFHLYLIRLINEGTLDFMSVEAESRKYFFEPQPAFNFAMKSIPALSDFGKPRVFHYNPLHDIESTWWVGVWTITCNGIIEDEGPGEAVIHAEEQKRLARLYFLQTVQSTRRTHLHAFNIYFLDQVSPNRFLGCWDGAGIWKKGPLCKLHPSGSRT